MPRDLSLLSPTLDRDPSGIWTARDAIAKVSFPEGGHGECYAIEDDSFWFAHRNECILASLQRHPFEGAFLDVGGGNGAVSKRLMAAGFETVLLEPGPDGAANARERGLPDVVCATLDQAAFVEGSFGGAGLFDVIEHVEDDRALVDGVRRVLSPGGVLCVTVPAFGWLWSDEDELAGHYRRYTVPQLRAVLERSGFEVRYASYFFAALTMPLFLLRSLRHRLSAGRPVSGASAAAQHTPHPLARRAIDAMLATEPRRIARGGTIGVGTSCIAVAVAR